MRLCYSNELRMNYILVESIDRTLNVDHIVRVARMHRCAKGKFVAVAFVDSDGTRRSAQLIPEHKLAAGMKGLTSVT